MFLSFFFQITKISLNKIVTLILMLAFSKVFAQKNNEIDSIQNIINVSASDSIKASNYKDIGSIYFYKLAYEDAFFYYSKADSICAQNDTLKTSVLRASLYNYLGYSVRRTHGMDKAVEFYNLSREMYRKIGDEAGVQEVNVGMAQMYTRAKEYNKALDLLNQSIDYHEKNNLTYLGSYSFAIICRGYLFIQMNEMNRAEKDYLTYYDIAFKGKNERIKLFALQYMGFFYKMSKEPLKAYNYYHRAIQTAKKLEDFETANVSYLDLIDMYKTSKNIDSLVVNYQRYIENRDVLDSINKDKEIYELEAKYQTDKKEQQIALLSAQNRLTEQRRKNQIYFYTAILGFLIALGGLLFFGYYNRLKAARRLKELDELKSRFFENISHEFRTPLTLIKSPVQQLKASADTKSKKQLDLIETNANRMLELVDQLLELSKIEKGKLKIILKKGNLTSFINSLIEPFVFQAKSNNIPFEVNVQTHEDLTYFDKDILNKIIVNLLSNAFKHRESGPVTFTTKIIEEKLKLEVTNYSTAIKSNNFEKLFDRFYQYDSNATGFGIGLSLVKELVTFYEGTIKTRLDDGKVIVGVEIPLSTTIKNAVIIDQTSSSSATNAIAASTKEPEDSPILLIADDNADIRSVLKDIFASEFTILEAENGKEAFEIAHKEIPDVLISDIMMPQVDGYALVKKLKEDELTSSIPIILLTAKASEKHHIKGLEHEVDAFISKPFSHELIKAKVQQLLQERKRLQDRYSRELVLKPMDIAVNMADEKFIEKLDTILNSELANSNFTADNFATAMNLSRMQLHRKLKSLLGVSATEFIRNERLKSAAKLLKESNISIAEAAYASGFNEVTYFSRSFKKLYGLSPSDFRKQV
jgi:signal transduction histidine kinase/DNA-binding response OmpR family regulator